MRRKPAVYKLVLVAALLSCVFALASCEALLGYKPPEWTSVAKIRDGREFVTDGSIALEVSYAGVSSPPAETSRPWFAAALSQNDAQERRELFSFQDIRASPDNPDVVVAPGNLHLQTNHINYLSDAIGAGHKISFWQQGVMQPVVVVIDGRGQGAIKPVSQ